MKDSQHSYPDIAALSVLSSLFHTRSLTLTGNELGTSTATASRLLAASREFFGDDLFVRSGPRMQPTPRMRELAPEIADLLGRLEALAAPHFFSPAKLDRTFRIAAADNGVLAFLFPAFQKILREAPHVRLDVIGLNGDLFEDLRNGRLDLAFFPFDPVPADCKSLVLADEPDVLLVRKGHPLSVAYRERGALTLEDIQRYPKVRISNVTHNFPANVVRCHAALMAHETEGAVLSMPYFLAAPWMVLETDATVKILERNGRLLERYLPVQVLPLPQSIAGRYQRRLIWHEKADHDPALRWVAAMIQATSRLKP